MADLTENQAGLSIGVIGGGRGGLQLFEFFASSRLAKIRFVVDPNPGAPAMKAAKARKIAVFTDFEEALRVESVDFIIETTGIDGFELKLAQRLAGTRTSIITHGMASLMIQVMAEHRKQTQDDVSEIVLPIKSQLSDGLQGSQAIVGRINQIMSGMQMLALNAGIEAAKAGVLGRGFAVVADQMGKSVETVRKLTQEIEGVTKNIVEVSHQIDSVLEKLK